MPVGHIKDHRHKNEKEGRVGHLTERAWGEHCCYHPTDSVIIHKHDITITKHSVSFNSQERMANTKHLKENKENYQFVLSECLVYTTSIITTKVEHLILAFLTCSHILLSKLFNYETITLLSIDQTASAISASNLIFYSILDSPWNSA